MGREIRAFTNEILFVSVRFHQERFFLTPFSKGNAVRRPRRKRKKGTGSGKPKRFGSNPGRLQHAPREILDQVLQALEKQTPFEASAYEESAYNLIGSRQRGAGSAVLRQRALCAHVLNMRYSMLPSATQSSPS